MTIPTEAAVRADTEAWLFGAVTAKDEARPRSKQVHLGFSDLGGCRELIRAKVTGEYATQGQAAGTIKWAAFVGTAVGAMVEQAVAGHGGAQVQVRVTCRLPRTGIEVTGDVDILRNRKQVIDLKGKAGLEDAVDQLKKGSPREYLIQISGYLVGLHQMGLVDDDAIGTLVYYDRSGKSTQVVTDSVTLEDARGWLEIAEERLTEIMHAVDAGVSGDYLRDQEESKCWYFDCPMYASCWAGYQPTEEITDPATVDAMLDYDRGREMAKAAKQLQDRAKQQLGGFLPEPDPDDETAPRPRRGVARIPQDDGTVKQITLDWKLFPGRDGLMLRSIDERVRTIKPKATKLVDA